MILSTIADYVTRWKAHTPDMDDPYNPDYCAEVFRHNEIVWETKTLCRTTDGQYFIACKAETFSEMPSENKSHEYGRLTVLRMSKAEIGQWLRGIGKHELARQIENTEHRTQGRQRK